MLGNKRLKEENEALRAENIRVVDLYNACEQERTRLANENLMLKHELEKNRKEPTYFG